MAHKVPPLTLSASLIIVISILSLFINTESTNSVSHFLCCFKWYQDVWLWIVVNTGTAFLWRGTWGLMDVFIYPDNLQKSYAISVISGMVLLAVAYALGKTNLGL